MAPRKRRSGGDEEEKAVPAVASRVTRRSSANQNGSSLPPDSKAKKNINKKAKISSNSGEDRAVPSKEEAAPPAEMFDDTSKHKTIIIEHCKQCNSFKTRAIQVKNGLENGVSGITVLLNPEKPRRGCFEIREEGGEKFITLLDMKRPFKPMKALDMDKVISDIIDKIK